jgi:hypothetical protein
VETVTHGSTVPLSQEGFLRVGPSGAILRVVEPRDVADFEALGPESDEDREVTTTTDSDIESLYDANADDDDALVEEMQESDEIQSALSSCRAKEMEDEKSPFSAKSLVLVQRILQKALREVESTGIRAFYVGTCDLEWYCE